MPERVRLGIVGCGGATQVMYVPVLRHVQGLDVTALCDSSTAALDRVQSLLRFAGPVYQDFDQMLRAARVDALIIATPVHLHRDQVVKAARAGKHVLCEKPMARTVAECDEMIAACEAAGVTLMVGFMKRFDKSMLHAKRLIDEGRLGTVYQLLCDWRGGQFPLGPFRTESPPWRTSRETLGGVFQDHGSHTTDLSRWWLGEITAVSGEFSLVGEHWDVENSAVGVYLHEGGARSIHLMGFAHKAIREVYQLDGRLSTLELQYGPPWSFASTDPFRMTLYEHGGRVETDLTQYNEAVLDLELTASGRYKRELDHFCASIREGTRPLTSGADGRKAIEVVNAVYLSAHLGEKVRLPLTISPDLECIFREARRSRG